MDGDFAPILNPGEVELYVQSLSPSKLEEFGGERWLEQHQNIQKLSQQAVLEASEHREEIVKDCFIAHLKTCILVHEAICVHVWREKVLPKMLLLEAQPKDTFIAYTVATAIALLETLLFHAETCESLEDSSLDLLDYCISAILNVLSNHTNNAGLLSSHGDSVQEQESILSFNIGIRCISILQYLIDSITSLPLSLGSRMYVQHDVPLLLTHLLEERPWERDNPKCPGQKLKYSDGQWMEVVGEDLTLTRSEGHAWLALRQILLKETCCQYYEMSDFRKSQLQKMLRYLTDPLLDQVAPLMDLKFFLCQLQMSSGASTSRRPIILEVIPQIRLNVLETGNRKWKKIAFNHVQRMFHTDRDCMQRMAQSLSSTYDLNVIERLSGELPKCVECGEPAGKRCSQCKVEWYCGRECQVRNWTKHKHLCNAVVTSSEDKL